MDLKLRQKVALITGSSKGLGFATALKLAEEGANVAINSRNNQSLEKAAAEIRQKTGVDVLSLPGDVTQPEISNQLVNQVIENFGQLDLLVCNAGGPPSGPFESFSDEQWHQAVELSFLSQMRLIRSALPALRQSKAASVLTITSYSVKQPIPNLVLSNSIRAATVGLTKTLALELGSEGIRFNSILPAWTETQRVYDLMGARSQQSGRSIEEEMALQAASSPMGRMSTPEEFANAAVFLLSPAASYITGVMLTVDGGMYKGTL